MKLNRTPSRTGPLASVRLWQLSMIVTAMALMTLLMATGAAWAAGTDGPAAPANLQADPGKGKVVLTWGTPNDLGITGYQYRLREGVGTELQDWVSFGGETTTSYTVAGLTNGLDYEIHVRAMEDGTPGTHSIVHAVPYLNVPKAPRAYEVTRNDAVLTLSWLPPRKSAVDSYEIRYAEKGDKLALRPWTSVGEARQYTTTVASSHYGKTWKFQVRAVNESGGGKSARVTTKPPELTAPENFSAFATSGTSAKLSWTPTNEKETAGWVYRVNWGSTKSQWTELTNVAVESDGSRSATVSGSSLCSPCAYQLKAYNDAGRSPLVRDKADHSKPIWTADVSQASGTDRVKLSWDESHIDLTGYRYRLNFGEWTGVSPDQVTVNGATRSWTLTGLASGTTYLLEIQAVNGVGAGQSTVETVVTK